MFRTCTCVPVYLCRYLCTSVSLQKVRTYLGTYLHIGQADKIQCQDLHVFFFSWGTFSLLVHTGRLEDDRSEGCHLLAPGSLYFCCFSFFFFFVVFGAFFFPSFAYVSKELGKKKEGTF